MRWECPECTLVNDAGITRCMACGYESPTGGLDLREEDIKEVFSEKHYMDCPKCTASMRQHKFEPSICWCVGCRGLWIDISRLTPASIDASSIDALRRLQSTLGVHGKTTEFLCPSCHSHRLKKSKHKETTLEWCPKCWGMYFDRGEMERIAKLQRDGRDLIPREKETSPGRNIGWGLLDVLGLLFDILD